MNAAQKIQLDRVALASCNFDGEAIAKGLTKHRHLWDAFVFGRFRYNVLIELRDLAEGHLNADTIMALTDSVRAEELMAIAQNEWHAQEVGYSGFVDGKFVTKWTDPCHTEKEFFQDLGGGIPEESGSNVLVRLWWD